MMRDEYPDTKTLAKSLRTKRETQQLMLQYNKKDFCSMVKQREYTILTLSDVINHLKRWDYSQGLPKGDYLYGNPSCFDEAANGKRFHCFTSKSFKTDHVEGEVFFLHDGITKFFRVVAKTCRYEFVTDFNMAATKGDEHQ